MGTTCYSLSWATIGIIFPFLCFDILYEFCYSMWLKVMVIRTISRPIFYVFNWNTQKDWLQCLPSIFICRNEWVWHYQFKCVRACFMFRLKGAKNSLKTLLFLKAMLWVEVIILELIMTRAIPHVNHVFWSE
jgi:hypothetical protein